MSWYYRDWDNLEDLIMVVTFLLAIGTLVAALVASVRSHHHVAAHAAVAARSGLHAHHHNGHRAA